MSAGDLTGKRHLVMKSQSRAEPDLDYWISTDMTRLDSGDIIAFNSDTSTLAWYPANGKPGLVMTFQQLAQILRLSAKHANKYAKSNV